VKQGRYEEAEELLTGVGVGSVEAARVVAALHVGRGEDELALEVIDRALLEVGPASTAAGPLLGVLVEAHLTRRDLVAAAEAAEQLGTCAALHPWPHLAAAAALARGRVGLVAGQPTDAVECLRTAVAGFVRAELPFEAAETRLVLAAALAADRPEVAVAEARAALSAFEQLSAARHALEAAALLRSLGARPASPRPSGAVLSKREAEVLELLAAGLSNPEMSARLYISRKTVEHHVGNVLAKLGLRSRAEAAAYAARRGSGAE